MGIFNIEVIVQQCGWKCSNITGVVSGFSRVEFSLLPAIVSAEANTEGRSGRRALPQLLSAVREIHRGALSQLCVSQIYSRQAPTARSKEKSSRSPLKLRTWFVFSLQHQQERINLSSSLPIDLARSPLHDALPNIKIIVTD
jgi:hypothetical protein